MLALALTCEWRCYTLCWYVCIRIRVRVGVGVAVCIAAGGAGVGVGAGACLVCFGDGIDNSASSHDAPAIYSTTELPYIYNANR